MQLVAVFLSPCQGLNNWTMEELPLDTTNELLFARP